MPDITTYRTCICGAPIREARLGSRSDNVIATMTRKLPSPIEKNFCCESVRLAALRSAPRAAPEIFATPP